MESWLYPTKDTLDTTWKLKHHPGKPANKEEAPVKNNKNI